MLVFLAKITTFSLQFALIIINLHIFNLVIFSCSHLNLMKQSFHPKIATTMTIQHYYQIAP